MWGVPYRTLTKDAAPLMPSPSLRALLVSAVTVVGIGLTSAPFVHAAPAPKPSPAADSKAKPDVKAKPVGPMPDTRREITTDDGWKVTVRKEGERVDRYPNLAQSPWTREGFVTLKAVGEIATKPQGKVPVQSAQVTTGYQLGCNTDVTSGITLTGGLSNATTVGVSPSVGVSGSVTGQGQGGTSGGQGGGSITGGGNAGVTGNLSDTLTETGQLAGTLKPGTISTITFGSKPLQGPYAAETFREVHIKVDACMGPVQLRSFATVSVVTARNTDTITTYGRPVFL